MSKITFTYKKNEYTLEYNRSTIKLMESQGFVLDEVSSKPANMFPQLFAGAFMKNHRGLKRNYIDEMFDQTKDKMGLMQVLIEMYAEALSSLVDDNPDGGNATWARVD